MPVAILEGVVKKEKELLNSLPLFPHKANGERLTESELNKLIEFMRNNMKK